MELQSDPSAGKTRDEVIVDYSQLTDFSQYSTYAFLSDPDADPDAPDYVGINEGRLRDAMRAEFTAIGMSEAAAPDQPDLEIVTLAYSEKVSQLSFDCVPTVYWYGFTGGYDSCAFISVSNTSFDVGTVIIGFGDASSQQVVFQAIAQGVADGNNIEARIIDVVADIFEQYPG